MLKKCPSPSRKAPASLDHFRRSLDSSNPCSAERTETRDAPTYRDHLTIDLRDAMVSDQRSLLRIDSRRGASDFRFSREEI